MPAPLPLPRADKNNDLSVKAINPLRGSGLYYILPVVNVGMHKNIFINFPLQILVCVWGTRKISLTYFEILFFKFLMKFQLHALACPSKG